jgi:hypothetical protein
MFYAASHSSDIGQENRKQTQQGQVCTGLINIFDAMHISQLSEHCCAYTPPFQMQNHKHKKVTLSRLYRQMEFGDEVKHIITGDACRIIGSGLV